MFFFSSKRILAFLSEVRTILPSNDFIGLKNRLSSRYPDQVLPAELELALIWAIHKNGAVNTQSFINSTNKNPDIWLAKNLYPEKQATVEITSMLPDTEVFEICKQASNSRLYKKLREKYKQLRDGPPQSAKVIILIDAGSNLAQRAVSDTWRRDNNLNPSDVILQFLSEKADHLDAVITISPRSESMFSNEKYWFFSCYDNSDPKQLSENIEKILNRLPKPKMTAQMAFGRASHTKRTKKDYFSYKRTNIRIESLVEKKMEIRVSAHAILQRLTDKMNDQELKRIISTDFLPSNLNGTFHIQQVYLEPGTLDEDDDYIVFCLEPK